MPLAPDTLLRDRYRIGERLASGRATATYRAHDTDLDTPCVVKVLSVGAAIRSATGADSYDPDDFTKLVELFEREARTLAHLDHPGIPRLVDHFTEEAEGDTRLHTVQELVEGRTLSAEVASGRHFTEVEARDVLRQLAEILVHIHGRSPPLIHRDIKPDNVILDDEGTVHLVDFGSVRTTVGIGELDGKTIVGTLGYMPLEQYEGRAGPESDIYALGGTLLYLLTHRAPHELPRDGMRVDFRPYVNVSEALADILDRMVEPDPSRRYRSAAALLRDLRWAERASPRPRSRVATMAAGLAAVVGGVGIASFLVVRARTDEAGAALRSDPVAARIAAPSGPATATDGTLAIDIYRHFSYEPTGWPLGRSVGQTSLGTLALRPDEALVLPAEVARASEAHFGFFEMGNVQDNRFALVLFLLDGEWRLLVDTDNDEDLTHEGAPARSQGTGKVMASRVELSVLVATADGAVSHPYHLWVWFDPIGTGDRYQGRFYGTNHFAGTLRVAEGTYDAVAYELVDHDALYAESGLCIDLDRDGTCQEDRELFYDGSVVPFREGARTLELRFP